MSSDVAAELEDHCFRRAADALRALPPDLASDAYVVSFYMWEEEQDPRRPAIILNVNTESDVANNRDAASDEDEARWNYAFWRREGDVFIAESEDDADGAALTRRWAEQIGTWVPDAELDTDEGLEHASKTVGRFWELAARVARRLHEEGVIVEVFGRPIPVILHELIYYEDIDEINTWANPEGVAAGFARWVREMWT